MEEWSQGRLNDSLCPRPGWMDTSGGAGGFHELAHYPGVRTGLGRALPLQREVPNIYVSRYGFESMNPKLYCY
jgi:hypothetical protein